MADATTTTEKPADAKPAETPSTTTANGNGKAAAAPAQPAAQVPVVQPPAQELPPISAALTHNLPIAMAIWFDEPLYQRAKHIASMMSKAEGITPPHLLGKPESCFFVVEKALTWKLSPSAVAMSTFQTPGGKIGFEGKLCQAILENSGHLIGNVSYEHFGDWSQVTGKFSVKRGEKSGKEYAHRDWTRTDALKGGCGVFVIATVRGKGGNPATRKKWPFRLEQAFPLNSTLWATDPETQICYAAVRRFGSVVVPGIFMGLPFDRDDADYGEIIDEGGTVVTPNAPTREQFADADKTEEDTAGAMQNTGEPEEEGFAVVDNDGVVMWAGSDPRGFCNVFIARMTSVLSPQMVEGLWDTNSSQLSKVPKEMAEEVRKAHADALQRFGWKVQPSGTER